MLVLATPTNPGHASFVNAVLTGASGSFVYRPGEPNPGGNVYADFNLLYADLIAVAGIRAILYDDDIVSPCPIPPLTGGGSYDFSNVHHVGSSEGNAPVLQVPVQFQDGATVSEFGLSSYLLRFESVSTSPVVTYADGFLHLVISDYGVNFVANGTAPFFLVHSGFLLLAGQVGVGLDTGLSAVVHLAGPGTFLQINLWDTSSLATNAITGAVGSTAQILYDASCQAVSTTQAGMLGAIVFSFYDFAERIGLTDNQGWVTPAPTNVQDAIDRLQTWSESISSWSTPIDGTVEAPAQFDRVLTIDPDVLREGDVLHILAAGEYTIVANPGIDTASISLHITSFGALNGNFGPVTPGAQFVMKAAITISSAGAAGTMYIFQENDFVVALAASYIPQQTGPHAIDTTTSNAITVEGNWGIGTPDGNEMILKTLQAHIDHRLAG